MSVVALGAVLLVCLGLLLGATWTTQVLHHKHQQLAGERRWLNEQWSMIRTARREGFEESHRQGRAPGEWCWCWCYQQRLAESMTEDD